MSSFEGLADHFDCENLDDGGSDSEHDSNNIRAPLLRWKHSALVLNASRRFRYTLDLKREGERKQNIRLARAHAQAILAAYLFKAAGEQASGTLEPPPSSSGDFAIGQDQLALISSDNVSALQQYGGLEGLSDLLKTNLEEGIQGDEADLLKRRNAFGSNTYPRKKGRSFLMFLWKAWQSFTLIILIVSAVASLALGIKTEGIKRGWYDGESIAFAVILIIVVRAISNYKQSLQFQILIEVKQEFHVEVIRGGIRIKVSIYDIVVGDVVPLNIGDQVPADGVLISGHSLAIDESSVTGNSKIVHKDSRDPFLMSGCKAADGIGTMLVTSVGMNTVCGSLMASTPEDTGEEMLLQGHRKGVLTFIGKVGLLVAVIVSVVVVVRYFINRRVQFKAGKKKVGDTLDVTIKNIVTVVVSIVVVTLPERRSLVSTVTLAHSVRKILADKVLVRRLSGFESMATATTICSDKTGTLTMNQMTVVEAYVGGKMIDPCNKNSELSPMLSSLLLEGIAWNTNGRVNVLEDGDIEVFGSPTEKAILYWGWELGMNLEPINSESSVIRVLPFNSEKKRGGIAVKLPDSQVHVHWKGATEIVLASCTSYMDATDRLIALDEDQKLDVKKAIEDMAARGLRCVANAYRSYEMEKVPSSEQLAQWALPEDNLVLLAIVGIKDPCRPLVKDAVQLCQNAGVKVRMVTGDDLETAKTIALECGILGSDAETTEPNLFEARKFCALSDKQREEIVDGISVMGRCSPNDKRLFVQALRKRGHVVAVTGDGFNDAPALHEADIGLAMGTSGTQVAKESSDIIILDDDFASVVKAVRWSQSVYANIRKFIQFERTANIAALIINVIAAISPGDVPLNAVQLLWVNIIVDTLGPLALATESPTNHHLMHRPPVGRRGSVTTNIIWRNLLIQTLYQVSILLVLNFRGRSLLNLENDESNHANKVKNTLLFNSFVLCQIFNEFNARKPDEFNVFKGVTKNCLFIGIVGLTVVFQVIIIEFLGKFTFTVRLNWSQWLISVVIGFISWPLDFLGKLIPVRATPFNKFFTSFHPRCLSKKNGVSQDSIKEDVNGVVVGDSGIEDLEKRLVVGDSGIEDLEKGHQPVS